MLVLTTYRFTPAQVRNLRRFVEAGGGLLAAATAWAWSDNGKKPYSQFPGNLLLEGSGVAWTGGFAGPTIPQGFSTTREVSPFANAANCIKRFEAGKLADSNELSTALESIRQTLPVLPDHQARFRLDVRKALKSLHGVDLVPSETHPVLAKDARRRFAVGLETAPPDRTGCRDHQAGRRKPVPGRVPATATRGTHRVLIHTAVPGWQSLGLYAPPGEVAVTVPRPAIGLKLVVQVGSHTDSLWHLDSWMRLPQVVRRFPITQPETTVANALGGLIYIDVPSGVPAQELHVTVKNAVESPLFRLGVTATTGRRGNVVGLRPGQSSPERT